MSEIVSAFSEIPTTCISDTTQGLNNMNPLIKPLQEERKTT